MFHNEMSRTDLTMLTATSVLLTIPFLFLAKDMANSLRVIAGRKSCLEGEGENPCC